MFTHKIAENTIRYGWYDRFLRFVLYRLDWYIECRSNKQWDSLKWSEPDAV